MTDAPPLAPRSTLSRSAVRAAIGTTILGLVRVVAVPLILGQAIDRSAVAAIAESYAVLWLMALGLAKTT